MNLQPEAEVEHSTLHTTAFLLMLENVTILANQYPFRVTIDTRRVRMHHALQTIVYSVLLTCFFRSSLRESKRANTIEKRW